jgi:organic radical activating enzyme
MSFDTVDLLTGNVFQVTWDLGRRCNYDCSYCPVTRHDNFSPHATLDELKANTDFLYEYIDTYMQHRQFKRTSIGFTGGEPTVNPNFIPFMQYLKSEYETRYQSRWSANFALTSNGAMGQKMAQKVMENFAHITVSYHAESNEKLKKQVRDRILQFHKDGPATKTTMSINVMFHAEHFDECKELCEWLDEQGIKYVPRVIGEEPDSRESFAHVYNDEQLDYMKNFWKNKNAKLNNEKETTSRLSAVGKPQQEQLKQQQVDEELRNKKDGNTVEAIEAKNKQREEAKKKESANQGYKVGRPCCGSREMCLSNKGQSRNATFVDMREFKGWHCSVNWFFLHLEQQTDQVFHHQTCQARFDGTRGPIGKISEGKKIVADLVKKLETNSMPTIVCPKHTCGCGLCAPKSKFEKNYKDVMEKHLIRPEILV